MGSKILIIDDDHDLAEAVKFVLEYSGYSTVVAHEGESGIELAKKENPDLIVMDVMMPGMGGAKALQVLQGEDLLKNVPVIFLTGLVSDGDELKSLQVGGLKYQVMAKPFDNEKLIESIKKALKQ